jgi:two-component system, NarL family, invasion response regulator UvrY
MNILLIADNPILVIGMSSIILKENPQADVLHADTVEESLRILQTTECQLLILDITVADGKNVDPFTAIRNWYPKMSTLVYLADEYFYLTPFSKAGANGFISHKSTEDEIREAIAFRSSVNRFISNDVQSYMVQQLATQTAMVPLSAKERLIARMLLEDKSYGEIALGTGISRANISTHKKRLFQKLGVSSVLELSRVIIPEGVKH